MFKKVKKYIEPTEFCVFPAMSYKDHETGEHKETEVAKNLHKHTGYIEEELVWVDGSEAHATERLSAIENG